MKKANIWTIIVVLLVSVNCVMLAFMWKEKRRMPPPDNHLEVKDFLVQQLSLTKDQVAKFDILRKAHHKAMDSLQEQLHLQKDSLFDNLSTPSAGASVVEPLVKSIGYNTALMDKTTFYHFKELRSILDPAQQKKFDSIIKQVLRMMERPMPPPGNGPPPRGMRPDDQHPAGQRPEGMPQEPPPGNGPPPGN